MRQVTHVYLPPQTLPMHFIMPEGVVPADIIILAIAALLPLSVPAMLISMVEAEAAQVAISILEIAAYQISEEIETWGDCVCDANSHTNVFVALPF